MPTTIKCTGTFEKAKQSTTHYYIAWLDYSDGAVHFIEHDFTQEEIDNDMCEEWLTENTSYDEGCCYYMTSTEPIEVVQETDPFKPCILTPHSFNQMIDAIKNGTQQWNVETACFYTCQDKSPAEEKCPYCEHNWRAVTIDDKYSDALYIRRK